MPILIERLRRALSPNFTVEGEISSGGMGRVYLGRDLTLGRPVAIKVLRPELASAAAAERFVREARILAKLRHPSIVQVFQGGEADGLFYHILDYQSDETLAQRLERGPLTRGELNALGKGLLTALAAAHEVGIVHRDIKPANIFFNNGRVTVGDFGIAHDNSTDEPLTRTEERLGTARYMAPEQWRGAACTALSDLYSAGLVLAESATGLSPSEITGAEFPRLPGLSGPWVKAIRRALSADPNKRWESATAFLHALMARRISVASVVVPAVALLVGLGVFMASSSPEPSDFPVGRFVVEIPRLTLATAGGDQAFADQFHAGLVQSLQGFPDFVVTVDQDRQGYQEALSIQGTVRELGDSVEISLSVANQDGAPRRLVRRWVHRNSPGPGIDLMVHDILVEIWRSDKTSELLLLDALPRSSAGFALFLTAEKQYANAEWSTALSTYENVERIDPSCILCTYRIRDLHRWLNRQKDTVRLAQLLKELHRFTPPYQAVIKASALEPSQRIDSLLAMRTRLRGFFDFEYLLGDELFHRGPLLGFPRRLAIEYFQHAASLRPDFSGVLEHLAWAYTVEGDSATADLLLTNLARDHPTTDEFTAGVRVLHQLAFAWRFYPVERARRLTDSILSDLANLRLDDLPAGPRMLPAFGAPVGAIGFGRSLQVIPNRPDLNRSGIAAQSLGWISLGNPDSAIAAAREVTRISVDPDWEMVELSIPAWLMIIGELEKNPSIGIRLREFGERIRGRGDLERRVEWMLAMLSDRELPVEYASGPDDPLAVLARGNALAKRGLLIQALAEIPADLDRADPFARATYYLLRAEWLAALGRLRDVLSTLLWSEHSDVGIIPHDELRSMEVDWAAATLAMWRRARILNDMNDQSGELCHLWDEVISRWSMGSPLYRARVDSARAWRTANASCRTSS